MISFGVAFILFGQVAGQTPDLADVKVFQGGQGQRVEVAMVKPISSNQALIRVLRADSPHDGLVMPCEVRREGSTTKYVTRHDGDGWIVMSQKEWTAEVEVPGRESFTVWIDKKATETATADDLKAAYEAQAKDGSLKMFRRKAYPKLEEKYDAAAKEASSKLKKSCGRDLPIRIDWGSIEDDVMADVNVWKACEPIAARLERSCAIAKQAEFVVCQMGTSFDLKIDSDKLVFTTTPKGKDEAASFLAKQK